MLLLLLLPLLLLLLLSFQAIQIQIVTAAVDSKTTKPYPLGSIFVREEE
jgi:hypothetical protein